MAQSKFRFEKGQEKPVAVMMERRVLKQYDSVEKAIEAVKWIEATLSNDENSTDEELIAYFQKVGDFTEQAAQSIVSIRNYYLTNI